MTRAGSALGLLLLGALACGEPAKTTPPHPVARLEVDGCQEVRGEVCVLRSAHRLTLWVEPVSAADPGPVLADGRSLAPESATAVQGGVRIEVVVPEGTRKLEIAGRSLVLEPSAWPEWMFEAQRRIRDRDFPGARELLAACAEELSERSRPACWTLLATALPSSERVAALDLAIAGHRAADHRLGLANALALAALDDIEAVRFEAGAERLDAIPTEVPRAAYLRAYGEGLLARKRGETGRALDRLTEAAILAERLGHNEYRRAAEQEQALALGEIGRFRSVVEILDRVAEDAPPRSSCQRLDFWLNVGWTRYLAREQGEDVADPVAAFEQARADLDESGCAARRFLLEVNLALALLQAGRLDEAEQALNACAAEGPQANLEERWWFGMAEAGLALGRGRKQDALAHYERLSRLEVPEAEWRALFGRALALGDGDEALAALEQANLYLDERLAAIPAREGREWLIAQSEPIARRELGILLGREQTARALMLVRRARARVLRGFVPAASGADGSAGFSAPPAGDLLLALHPLDRERWALFAQLADRPPRAVVVTLRAGPLEPTRELAATLLGHFTAELGHARRLRVLPYGRLRELDFHALPWGAGVVLDVLPVVYGLDLPERRRLRGGGGALVVGNPRGDLAQAAEEADEVAQVLAARGREITRLVGLEADAERVLAGLARGVEILHFAGHADFAGPGGWQSELRLARGSRLTLADLLALERAPDWVVLSACESGKTTVEARVEGLGLAQTFLLGGSRGVVATSRPVEDFEARVLVVELYRAWDEGVELSEALRQAQRTLRQRAPNSTAWAAFRLLEP